MTPSSRHTDPANRPRPRVCVVIPTYNNAGTIGDVIRGVRRHVDDVIVVDDGSTDGTAAILRRSGVRTVTHPSNRGKGAALRAGLTLAGEEGFDYAVTIDGDGQHNPDDLPRFVRAIESNPGALIMGTRNLKATGMDGKSSFANRFSNFWFAVQTGRRLPDTQCGYRAYPLAGLPELRLMTARYEAELTLPVFAAWHGIALVPLDIDVYYPPRESRVSHFRPFRDFARISALNTALCLAAVFYGYPRRLCGFLFRKGFLRSCYAWTVFVGGSLFYLAPVALFMSLKGGDVRRKKRRFHDLLRKGCRFLTRGLPGAVTTHRGLENADFDRPAMLVCNHRSFIDLPITLCVDPRIVVLTHERILRNPVYGRIAKFADFKSATGGLDALASELGDLVRDGYSILVFPEGTRGTKPLPDRFRAGAFMLAERLGLDIQPMAIAGTGEYLPKGSLLFGRSAIDVTFMRRYTRSEIGAMTPRGQARFFRALVSDGIDAGKHQK